MTKKRALFLAVLFCALAAAGASGNNTAKKYSDAKSGFEGWASAEYLSPMSVLNEQGYENLKAFADDCEKDVIASDDSVTYRRCNKLSRQDNYLIRAALGEYDYSAGEVYLVAITSDPPDTTNNALLVFVAIAPDGRRFDWAGFYVAEK